MRKVRFWKYVGPFSAMPDGKWITETVPVAGLAGCSVIMDAEDGVPEYLVVNGQLFMAECEEVRE